MDLSEAMIMAFEYLEVTYKPTWRSGKGSKDNLLKAFSQNSVPKHEYLGYKGSDGIRHAFGRAIPLHNKPKNALWEVWLLHNIGKFECKHCEKVLDLSVKLSDKYICKECEKIRISGRREDNQYLVYGILSTSKCMDCGESNPVVLEFDHRNPKEKLFNIGEGYLKNKEVLLLEIEKCDIVCANCHRIRTAKTYNYFSYRFSTK